MKAEELYREVAKFSKETHGATDLYKESVFIVGKKENEFGPIHYILKKVDELANIEDLMKMGFVYNSFELLENTHFKSWFEKQFSRKLTRVKAKEIFLVRAQKSKKIFDAISKIDQCYQLLKDEKILLNGKNLPVQLGEWYAKSIFGLTQKKSASQRGFDFFFSEKRVEVKVYWSDTPSPKGVKVRKTMLELSELTIVIYISKNFMIREVCLLDSSFVLRKFSGKGHTVFLKDSNIAGYFFTKSSKHFDKVRNPSALLKYSTPKFAMNLSERLPEISVE